MRTIIYSPSESGSFFSGPEGSGPLPGGLGSWLEGFGPLSEGFGAISATNKTANINKMRLIVSIIQVSLAKWTWATWTCRPVLARDKLAPESQRCEGSVARGEGGEGSVARARTTLDMSFHP